MKWKILDWLFFVTAIFGFVLFAVLRETEYLVIAWVCVVGSAILTKLDER